MQTIQMNRLVAISSLQPSSGPHPRAIYISSGILVFSNKHQNFSDPSKLSNGGTQATYKFRDSPVSLKILLWNDLISRSSALLQKYSQQKDFPYSLFSSCMNLSTISQSQQVSFFYTKTPKLSSTPNLSVDTSQVLRQKQKSKHPVRCKYTTRMSVQQKKETNALVSLWMVDQALIT